jgi:endogenous inhibitor of DNA gyrase (YacG/DUF329 family)
MSGAPPPGDEAAAKLAGVRVSAAKCVRCGAAVQPRHRPFCSQRCADADLGAWFTGRYKIETSEALAEPAGRDDREG